MRLLRLNFFIFIVPILFLGALPVAGQNYSLHLPLGDKPRDSRLFFNWQFFDEDLMKQLPSGNYVVYWDSTQSTKYLEGKYVHEVKEGIWTFYHLNGLRKRTVPYSAGIITGEVVEYSYSGDTLEITYYPDGVYKKQIHWNNYYGLTESKNHPDFMSESPSPDLSIRTDYDTDGRVNHIDSHNYKTNQRHATSYDETGRMYHEYFESMQAGGSSRSVSYPTTDINLVTGLDFNLNKAQGWRRLDSIKFYKNLNWVTIQWRTSKEVSADSCQLLNEKIAILKSYDKLKRVDIVVNGKVPANVFEMSQLTTLTVSSPYEMDARIGELKQLTKLEWTYSDYFPSENPKLAIPESIKNLSQLTSLVLVGYIMDDPDKQLRKLKPLKKLEILNLGYCGFTTFPKSIASLKSLRLLYFLSAWAQGLRATTFTTLPPVFFTMTNLRCVCLPISVRDSTIKTYIKRLPLCMFETESMCFTGETMIAMADGSEKQIREIKTGDIVMTYDFTNNRIDTGRVKHTIKHSPENLTMIEMRSANGKLLHITPNHPVFSANGEFHPAIQFANGDPAYSFNASFLAKNRMVSVHPYSTSGVSVYNIGTTKKNYFANGFLVHNK